MTVAVSPYQLPQTRAYSSAAPLQLLLILVLGLFIYTWKLGDAPLDRTEPHRALVAHQMVQSGQWLIPRLYGEIYLRKPPLIYWIEGAAEMIGGGNEWTWRLPSAVASALLAVWLSAWAARWFGPAAVVPTGMAALATLALWAQARSADIDAMNTATSVVCASIILELLYGSTRRPWLWAIGLALSLGATLMLKGPAGLALIIGALLGPSLVLRDWRWLKRADVWLGIIAGAACFGGYIAAAARELHRLGFPVDSSGIQEGTQRLMLHRWEDVGPSILSAILIIAYSMPISLSLLFAAGFVWKRPADDLLKRRTFAIIATILAAIVLWMLTGNASIGYQYVLLPMLAPLVGLMGYAWVNGEFPAETVRLLRGVLIGYCVVLFSMSLGFAIHLWRHDVERSTLAIAAGASVILGIISIVCWAISRDRVAGYAMILLLASLGITSGANKNLERRQKSALGAGRQLRQIVGREATVNVASMIRDMPELFYYSGLEIHALGEGGVKQLLGAGEPQWVVLSQNARFPEYSTISQNVPGAFPRGVVRLDMPDPRDQVFVGWYQPPDAASEAKVRTMPTR